jgi:metal-sulfur cluster biosynthetic enzyme
MQEKIIAAGVTAEEAREALREVFDPEYPISLVDLGLIRGVEVEESKA